MELKKMLPIGSVVRLSGAYKKIVIMGTMQTKLKDGILMAYDYLGVPFPEGYFGPESGLLFNHDSIEEVVFEGYQDLERERFVQTMEAVARGRDRALQEGTASQIMDR